MTFKITPSTELVALGMGRTFALAAGTGLGPILPFVVFHLAGGEVGDVSLLSRTLMLVSAIGLVPPIVCLHIFPEELRLLELAKKEVEAKESCSTGAALSLKQ